MSYIKQKKEIEIISKGGEILGRILESLVEKVEPGVSAYEIDKAAEKMIIRAGGRPSFKNYRSRKGEPPFPSTICACINEEIVHGIASKDKILKSGDIFTIDIGMQWPVKDLDKGERGYFTDTSITVSVGEIPNEARQLLNVTKKALEIGISKCYTGNTIADIGKEIQDWVEPQGYGIVRDLVGHGVGHEVHESPRVPNFYDKDLENWKLEPGVVIAIEPMLTLGNYEVITADDGWSVATKDASLSAHFEHTVVITTSEPLVVTRRPEEIKYKL
ncbi:MAG: type I methionyl aminopeptidase [Candidatus Magasanikbacteria bacterium]|nr:type I methionyl aminopeptidase [Candidatus Magasanikbacteria bacterium]